MFLKSLYLRNFRNFEEAEISFSPLFNVIFGENAQGKTNLLEAISLVSTGRSFRTQHLHELIRESEGFFYLEAEFVREGVTHRVKISFDGQNRRLQFDSNAYSHFHPLLGILPSVLHTPSDEELISGSPNFRRRFLNLHLAQSDPLYVHHFSRYVRAMKQRNFLLRSSLKGEEIECWEAEMALSAAYLLGKRSALLGELYTPLAERGGRLSSGLEQHELRFHPSYPPQKEHYLQQLQKNRSREKEVGWTLTGPHRDDFSFWIGGRQARLFASEGQKKSAVAALRLAEWDCLSREISAKPLMAVDDLGSPLDEERQAIFLSSLDPLGQVFVTTSTTLAKEPPSRHPIRIAKGSVVAP